MCKREHSPEELILIDAMGKALARKPSRSDGTLLTLEVREILEAAQCSGPHLKLAGQLDRKAYVRVDKILGIMGGVWNRKLRVHVFDGDAEEAVADALATGSVVDLRKLFQFFPTPVPVAEQLVAMAEIRAGMTVLEPSAGDGRIAMAAKRAKAVVSVCEIQERFHAKLKAEGFKLVGTDFLTLPRNDPGYDAVIGNPPFTRGQDVQHVMRMIGQAKPGGIVVSVMSPAWTFRTTVLHREFREMVARRKAEWVELPDSTFAESGTHVRVGVLVIRTVRP